MRLRNSPLQDNFLHVIYAFNLMCSLSPDLQHLLLHHQSVAMFHFLSFFSIVSVALSASLLWPFISIPGGANRRPPDAQMRVTRDPLEAACLPRTLITDTTRAVETPPPHKSGCSLRPCRGLSCHPCVSYRLNAVATPKNKKPAVFERRFIRSYSEQ